MFQLESQNDLLKIKAVGKLTAQDYETTLIPAFEKIITTHGKVRLLIDLTEFSGWELAAAWDDFKIGMKHRKEISKAAIIGNKLWEEWVAKTGNLLMPGEMRYFHDTQQAEASSWINVG